MTLCLPEGARLENGPGGLDRLVIDRPLARGELFLHGATLTGWAPSGADPVLWVSPKAEYAPSRPIRGGVPLCFPWFGPRPGAPQHGFARTSPWRLASAETDVTGALLARLELGSSDETRALYPHHFILRFTVSMGAKLSLELELENLGEMPLEAEVAFHAYFRVSDVRNVEVRGLEEAAFFDRVGPPRSMPKEGHPLVLCAETDRLYPSHQVPVELWDPGLMRRISIQREGLPSTVVWNPWAARAATLLDLGAEAWTQMLCIEPAAAGPDAFTLAPRAKKQMRVQVVVNPGT